MNEDRTPVVEDLVNLFSSALGIRQLYFRDHPKVRDAVATIVSTLRHLPAAPGQDALFVGLVDGKLVLEGRFLPGPNLLGSRLVELLAHLRCGGILLRSGLDEEEFLRFLDAAVEIKDPCADLEEARRLLASRELPDVELSPLYEDAAWFGQFFFEGQEHWDDGTLDDAELDGLVEQYQGLFDTVDGAHGLARSEERVDLDAARSTSEALIDQSGPGLTDILRLVRYPDYDTFTVGHSVRVALLAVLTAQRAGLPRELLTELGTAALLHDVGKALVPDEILFKPDRLDEAEFDWITRHPILGARLLLDNPDASSLAIGAAWGHHRRHDGGGYPRQEAWAHISPLTELIHICDVFEALTAIRPYKRGLTPRRAYEIMLEDHGAFDPELFRWFVRAMGMYPPGHLVVLDEGEIALVLSAGRDVCRPTVRITHDRRGLPIERDAQPVLDLASPEAAPRRILGIAAVPDEERLRRGAA